MFKQKVEPFFVYYIRNLILDNADGTFDAFGQRRIQRVHTLYQGGLNIYTSLDPSWQEYAQEAVDASPAIDPGRNSPDVSLVSVRATDGAIKAMLSGKNYNRDQYDLVWRGTRQVGSAFKPFTLVAAFEQGFPQGKVYSSKSPLCNLAGWISASGCVSNAEGGGDSGYLDLWSATQNSVNVVFAQLALDVGPEHIVDVAHRMGITVALDPVPSITLGVEEVPTMDMAAAFATLANDGKRCNAWAVRRVEFANVPKDAPKDERVLYQHQPECEQVIKPEIAHLVTAMLQRVVCCGTGHGGEHRPPRGREDRHRAGLHERVLRRLHAAGLDRGLGGVRERPDPDGHATTEARCSVAPWPRRSGTTSWSRRWRASRSRASRRRRRPRADRCPTSSACRSRRPRGSWRMRTSRRSARTCSRSSRPARSSRRLRAAAPGSSSGAR